MRPGIVTFAGAGPGAVDLLTLRCRDAIAEADAIVYAGSLVNPDVLEFARDDVEIHDSAALTLEQTTQILVETAREGKKPLRLHTGDPSVYGAIAEQIGELKKADVGYEIIPGVSSVFAAAASLGCELTLPGTSQTVILTRRAGRTPVPEGQEIPSLAAHGATMALYLSVADMQGLVSELIEGGYSEDTPVGVVYRASWPDEKIVRGTLATICDLVTEAGIRRQALVLVGGALAGAGDRSLLYAPQFAHGYRGSKRSTPFLGRVALYAITEAGCKIARRIAEGLHAAAFMSEKYADAEATPFDPRTLQEQLATNWDIYDAHVMVMATGIAMRKTAPLLRDKTRDPAVVVCDERGRFAISLLSGHIGGANRLSQQVAILTGGVPVITTATDVQGVPALDELAALQGWRIRNPEVIKEINSALLQRKSIGFIGPEAPIQHWYGNAGRITLCEANAPLPDSLSALAVLDAEAPAGTTIPVLRLTGQPLVLGIGCRKGTAAETIREAVDTVCCEHAISPTRFTAIASAEAKRNDEGLAQVAEELNLPITYFPSEELKAVDVPTPSEKPAKHIGTPSVAEAASLLKSKGRLLVPKQIHAGCVTIAIAVAAQEPSRVSKRATAAPRGRLVAVGIGPGSLEMLTPQALSGLRGADVVVGYTVYCDQVRHLLPGKRFISTGMRREVERCKAAIDEAATGSTVAMICSGDAGIYGMAGLLMELLNEDGAPDIDIDVVPGITAASSTAAALGAPLMNDFAVISLSDLLTPRETIVRRLHAVAAAGMACALYNPRSRKRKDLFDKTLKIFAAAHGDGLPCGLVSNAGREGEEQWVGPLRELPVERVDMFTTVILGGADTAIVAGRLVTRRGYKTRDNS